MDCHNLSGLTSMITGQVFSTWFFPWDPASLSYHSYRYLRQYLYVKHLVSPTAHNSKMTKMPKVVEHLQGKHDA